MKINLKKVFIIPLLLAVAVSPVCGQSADTNDNGTNRPPAEPAAPATPAAPQAPVEPATAAMTNGAAHNPKHQEKPQSSDDTPVRIDDTGIHVGGPNPVDINIPGLSVKAKEGSQSRGPGPMPMVVGLMSGNEGTRFAETLIALTAILSPFIFVVALVAIMVFSRHRRNSMLHETLRQMIDKGVAIPPELIVPPERSVKPRARSDLRAGLIILAIGLGVVGFLGHGGRMGWIAVFVGVAFLITWLVEKKANTNNDGPVNK